MSLLAMQAPDHYGGGRTFTTWSYRVVEAMARLEYDVRFADPDGATNTPCARASRPACPTPCHTWSPSRPSPAAAPR
ncbi:hypothetical protein GCM10010532_002560 [Dactylosporangium siamense]|uniref:Uncharacterized protein n=1 Tax=Dactylosporangium siamense TaxID=685454 RepID=A0A919PKS6_9ACTN|nr:hypothetical protein Dsi01nite_023110 [Dactylosporangium siamense]